MKKSTHLLLLIFLLFFGSSIDLLAEEKVTVNNGHVIIDGRYIEPPYELELTDKALYINGVLAEKQIDRDKGEIIREQLNLQIDLYADYFELGEKVGRQKAREEIKGKLAKKEKINQIKAKGTAGDIQITLKDGKNFIVHLPIEPNASEERTMFHCLMQKKFDEWYLALSDEEEEKFRNEIVVFLDRLKAKNKIDDYQVTIEPKNISVIRSGNWQSYSSYVTKLNQRRNRPRNIAELKKKDEEKLMKAFEGLARTLSCRFLEAFSNGHYSFGSPSGDRIINNLIKTINDQSLSSEKKKEKIGKFYPPVNANNKHFKNILENFEGREKAR